MSGIITSFIGSSIDEIVEKVNFTVNPEYRIVVNMSGIIIDILYKISGTPSYKSLGQDYNIRGTIVDINDYHPERYFDQNGDCIFRYYIPLELFPSEKKYSTHHISIFDIIKESKDPNQIAINYFGSIENYKAALECQYLFS
jgi:hypothetical protein